MALKSIATPTIEVENNQTCAHHWVIEPAMGPSSPGVCQICGESRDFQNYVEAASWGDSRHADRSAAAGKEVMALTNSGGQDEDDESD